MLRLLAPIVGRHPNGFGARCCGRWTSTWRGCGRWRSRGDDGPRRRALAAVVRGAYRPHWCSRAAPPDGVPLLEGRGPVDGRAAAYVCEHFSLPGTGHRARWSWTALDERRPSGAAAGSQHRQVALQLPGGDLDAVVVPLLALDLDVAVEHVLAERAQDELRLGGQLDRLAEGLGQLVDARAAAARPGERW